MHIKELLPNAAVDLSTANTSVEERLQKSNHRINFDFLHFFEIKQYITFFLHTTGSR